MAQTAAWIQERVKTLSAQVPFLGDGLNSQARSLAQSAREASGLYTWEPAEKALRANQNLSRELLKLMKMAQSGSGQGRGQGQGEGEGQGEGSGGPRRRRPVLRVEGDERQANGHQPGDLPIA